VANISGRLPIDERAVEEKGRRAPGYWQIGASAYYIRAKFLPNYRGKVEEGRILRWPEDGDFSSRE
jgi:hypothetical protein